MNSLSKEQKKMIILKYGEVRNLTEVRRYFGTKHYPKHPRKVPQLVVFKMVIDRFCETGSCRKERPPGRTKVGEENVAAVRNFFKQNEGSSVRCACNALGLSYGTVWSILRKKVVLEGAQITTASIPHSSSSGIQASGLQLVAWIPRRMV